ncbi:hypothetical protein [Endozoicomonas sp. ISHI1]|uniref:hypothetical protein n=1 Tax=Endozoicomonas sp. ISHI1 TaxID=2825882 RepID=UPI0021497AF3|nr:hypothetical protein [Endozoicomonas sp. ISHI1]
MASSIDLLRSKEDLKNCINQPEATETIFRYPRGIKKIHGQNYEEQWQVLPDFSCSHSGEYTPGEIGAFCEKIMVSHFLSLNLSCG